MKISKILDLIFSIYLEDAHIILKIFGIKMRFKFGLIDRFEASCCIPNLKELKAKNVIFIHPVGIVINKHVQIGENTLIYQNVTIGDGKRNPETGRTSPIIGKNVVIYSNSVIIGGITIGDKAIIGAGSVVLHDVPAGATVAGNPAKIISHKISAPRS